MAGQQAPSATARHALETLDVAIQGTRAYGREDLAERLSSARRLLTDSTVMVHVVGEFKQGKSSLVNALLTAPICPVDDDIATAVSTEVRYAEQVCASANVNRRRDRLAVCRMLETLWAFPYERSTASDLVDQLEQDMLLAGSRKQAIGVLKQFLPHELLRAVAAVREPEVVAYYHFLNKVVRELNRRTL